MKKKSYRPPVSEYSTNTFVTERSKKNLPGATTLPKENPESYPQQALPEDNNSADDDTIYMGPASLNTPDDDSQISERPRTLPEPGAERGHPVRQAPGTAVPGRRTLKGVRQRPKKRQRKQRGESKRLSRKYYRKNRNKYKRKARQRYKRNKNKPQFKKQRKIRRKNPNRFKRRRASEDMEGVAFIWGDNKDEVCYIDSILKKSERIFFKCGENFLSVSVPSFLTHALFLSEEDIDTAFKWLDETFDLAAYDDKPPTAKEAGYVFHHEEKGPHDLPNNWRGRQNKGAPDGRNWTLPPNGQFNKISPADEEYESTNRGKDLYIPEVEPGASSSGRVIPEYSNDLNFVNKKAYTASELIGMVPENLKEKSKTVTAYLEKVDENKNIYYFKSKDYTIKIRKEKKDLKVSCTCPFWIYQGSEYWAKKLGYLLGKPQGTATKPKVRDPDGEHKLCKHLIASLSEFSKMDV